MKATKRFVLMALTTSTVLTSVLPAHAAIELNHVNPYSDRVILKNDKDALKYLTDEYDRNSFTYQHAIEWIDLNKPSIKEAYLDHTYRPEETAEEDDNSFLWMFAGVGAVTAAAYAILPKGKKPSTPDPQLPPQVLDPRFPKDPTDVDPAPYRTAEYKRNWGLDRINAAVQYARGATGQNVKVAITDTGIDMDNPEFDGRIDTENSFNYFNLGKDVSDSGLHGTHVAGIIAAGRNNFGIQGVAPEAELVVFNAIGSASGQYVKQSNWLEDSINRTVASGAKISNNSWTYVQKRSDGRPGNEAIPVTKYASREQSLSFMGSSTYDAYKNAVDNDVLFVTATGNDAASQPSWNAGFSKYFSEFDGHFIAVTSTDRDNNLSTFANKCGDAKDFCLAAPGTDIYSVYADKPDFIVSMSGTSMAAPHVSGSAALLKSSHPELTAPEISRILFDTAVDLGAAGVDEVYGQGLLNLTEAMKPQGQLSIYNGTSTNGGKQSFANSAVYASSALSAGMTKALASQEIMVADKYDRGFQVSGASLVAGSPAVTTGKVAFTQVSKLGAGLSVLSSTSGSSLRIENDTNSIAINHGRITEHGYDRQLTPLSFVDSRIGGSYDYTVAEGLKIHADFSGADEGQFKSQGAVLGMSAQAEGTTIKTSFGALHEKGTVLGSQFTGATGQGANSQTKFLQIQAAFAVGDGGSFEITGTRSNTDFSQSGMITSGHGLTGTAGSISFSQERFMNLPGKFTTTISTPLQVTSGQVTVDAPRQRAAASGNTISTGVERAEITSAFEVKDRPIDVAFGYSQGFDQSNVGIDMTAGYRLYSGQSAPFAGFSVSMKF